MTKLKSTWVANDTGHVAEHNLIGAKVNRMEFLTDYVANDGVTDATDGFQTLINTLSAAGGGIIYAPKGSYSITANLTWANNVSLFGEGLGATIFVMGANGQFYYDGSLVAPLINCVFQDFAVDGSAHVGWKKGFNFTYCTKHSYHRVFTHDTGATGFGCDQMVDSVFDSCIAVGCGRNGTVETAGCSGFGIGTGAYQVSTVSLINCVARGNKRYGAFFEVQGDPPRQLLQPGVQGHRWLF